jgi:hypothetical protein
VCFVTWMWSCSAFECMVMLNSMCFGTWAWSCSALEYMVMLNCFACVVHLFSSVSFSFDVKLFFEKVTFGEVMVLFKTFLSAVT